MFLPQSHQKAASIASSSPSSQFAAQQATQDHHEDYPVARHHPLRNLSIVADVLIEGNNDDK
jgi:hypothetical protein